MLGTLLFTVYGYLDERVFACLFARGFFFQVKPVGMHKHMRQLSMLCHGLMFEKLQYT